MQTGGPPPAAPVLGWREHVALPAWGIPSLRAKLDTGARTSALHVEDLEELPPSAGGAADPPVDAVDDGEALPTVRFHVLTGPRDAPRRVAVTAPVVGHTVIRDTRARPERRPIVRTRVVCGPLDREIDVSLTDRTGMNLRLLLGRRALHGVLVDPTDSFLVSPAPGAPRSGSPRSGPRS